MGSGNAVGRMAMSVSCTRPIGIRQPPPPRRHAATRGLIDDSEPVTYNIAFQPGKIGVPANVPLTLTWTTVTPGDHPFTCTVHPNMVGAIIAQP